jgi:hypothetical protein
MTNFNHELARRNAIEDVSTKRLFFDYVGEVFGRIETDVGIEQSSTDFFERFSYVNFGDLPLSFQDFKGSFKLIG